MTPIDRCYWNGSGTNRETNNRLTLTIERRANSSCATVGGDRDRRRRFFLEWGWWSVSQVQPEPDGEGSEEEEWHHGPGDLSAFAGGSDEVALGMNEHPAGNYGTKTQ